jgi:NAD(P)H-hydrate epimerase
MQNVIVEIGAYMTAITLRAPSLLDEEIFLKTTNESVSLYASFIKAPQTHEEYLAYLAKGEQASDKYFLAWMNNEIIGVFNISGIAQEGVFKSAYLGVNANIKFAGKGLMSQALKLVLQEVFLSIKLHRIEANIQPDNLASILLFSNNGFQQEGYSPRYLYIADAWRDHLRFALTYEDWVSLDSKSQPLLITRKQARAIDKICVENYSIPSVILMENAGRGIVDYLLQFHPKGKIIICCGKGNNGGDGLVVARHLDNKGYNVAILLFAEPGELQGNTKINYDIALSSAINITIIGKDELTNLESYLNEAEWIIDALFGNGLQGPIAAPYDIVIDAINASGKKVLAIDIPSGLDCDNGETLGTAIIASHTATMAAKKIGFTNPKAKKYLGLITIIDIGAPKSCLEPDLIL